MYHYKLKYIVIVEDEEGEFIEQAADGFYDTEEEALEFIKDMEDNLY